MIIRWVILPVTQFSPQTWKVILQLCHHTHHSGEWHHKSGTRLNLKEPAAMPGRGWAAMLEPMDSGSHHNQIQVFQQPSIPIFQPHHAGLKGWADSKPHRGWRAQEKSCWLLITSASQTPSRISSSNNYQNLKNQYRQSWINFCCLPPFSAEELLEASSVSAETTSKFWWSPPGTNKDTKHAVQQ